MRLTIKAKVFSLALIPPLLIAVFLTWYNLSQSTQVAQNAVSDFKSQMETDAREEVRNYLQLAMSSIEHLVADDSLGSLQERQERARRGREQRGPPTPHEAAWWRWQPGSARPAHRPVPRGGGGGGGCASPPRGAATARQRLDGCVGSTSDPVQRRNWPSPPLRGCCSPYEAALARRGAAAAAGPSPRRALPS